MSQFSFRIKPARADNSAMVTAILNALNESNGHNVIVAGTVSDEQYNGITEQFGSDEGTVALRFDAVPTAIKSAVTYRADRLPTPRKFAWAPLEVHNGDSWNIVGYSVRGR